MQLKLSIHPRTLSIRLTIGVMIFTLISTGIQISKYVYGYRSEWMDTFNLDREMNLPTWYSALMLAFCAILLGIIAAGKKTECDRFYRQWKLLSTIFWFLAIDEVLTLHEVMIIPEVANALRLPWFLHSMWVIPGTILVVIFIKKYWRFTQHLPKPSSFHFILAAIFYIGGALIMEMVGSYFAELQGQQHLPYALIATLEEVMEMMGIIIFIYGLLVYIRQWSNNFEIEFHVSSSKRNSKISAK